MNANQGKMRLRAKKVAKVDKSENNNKGDIWRPKITGKREQDD